jgi:branched-chain amino acid aminotransferase
MPTIWINGVFKDDSEATVPLRDAGLLHGAGVFTTMRAYQGKVFRLAQHLRRLRDSCDALFIPLQHKDEALTAIAGELLQRNNLSDARVRLTVTRGTVAQDPLHGMHVQPTAFLTAAPLEAYPRDYYERGMTVILLDEQKANPYDVSAGHKTLNYLSRLAALRAATQRQGGEALWFNVHNFLQSSSIANVFLVENGGLVTPPTQAELRDPAVAAATPYPRSNVLPGVTRGAVLDMARDRGINVSLAAVDVNRLLAAEEVFLTNSIMGIMPVCRIERKPVGADKPGEMTRRLADMYATLIEGEIGS